MRSPTFHSSWRHPASCPGTPLTACMQSWEEVSLGAQQVMTEPPSHWRHPTKPHTLPIWLAEWRWCWLPTLLLIPPRGLQQWDQVQSASPAGHICQAWADLTPAPSMCLHQHHQSQRPPAGPHPSGCPVTPEGKHVPATGALRTAAGRATGWVPWPGCGHSCLSSRQGLCPQSQPATSQGTVPALVPSGLAGMLTSALLLDVSSPISCQVPAISTGPLLTQAKVRTHL